MELNLDGVTCSQTSDLEVQPLQNPGYLDEVIQFTQPSKKKQRVLKIPSLLKIDRKSEDVELHNMENSSKVSFACKFIDRYPIKSKEKGLLGYSYILQCLSELPVSIPVQYSDKNDKNLMNAIKAVLPSTTFRAEKDVEPYEMQPGALFKVSDFNPVESDFGFFFGRVVLLSNVHLRVQFEAHHDDRSDLPYEKRRMIGDPYVDVHGVVKMQLDRTLDDFYHILKKNENYKEIIRRTLHREVPEIPKEARLEGVYDAFVSRAQGSSGVVSSMVMAGQAPKPAGASDNTKGLKTPYNFTIIPTKILYERKQLINGFWAHLDNAIPYMSSKGLVQYVEDDDKLPFIGFHPPGRLKDENADVMKITNYHFTLSSTGEKKPFLSNIGDSIVGFVVGDETNEKEPEYNISAKTIFDVGQMTGFTHGLSWSTVGPMMVRGWNGLCFILIDKVEDTTLPSSEERKFCISGKLMVYLDPKGTFSTTGLKVSKKFAKGYLDSQMNVKSSFKPDARAHSMLNPYSIQYIKTDFKHKPNFLNLREFEIEESKSEAVLGEDKWDFYMIPPESLVTPASGIQVVEDPFNSGLVLKTFDFFEKNKLPEHGERENEIKGNWYSDAMLKSNIAVFAVNKDYQSKVQYGVVNADELTIV